MSQKSLLGDYGSDIAVMLLVVVQIGVVIYNAWKLRSEDKKDKHFEEIYFRINAIDSKLSRLLGEHERGMKLFHKVHKGKD